MVAAWVQEGALHVARRSPGGAAPWGSTEILPGPALASPDLALVADVAGNVTLAVTEEQNRVTARRYSATLGTWAPAVSVGAPAQGDAVLANDPVAVVDPSGNVTLGWFAWHRVGGADDFVLAANQLR